MRSKNRRPSRYPRAGKEPAEDVKRHMREICTTLGLCIDGARMSLFASEGYRLITVQASTLDWCCKLPQLQIVARVPLAGDWPENATVYCQIPGRDWRTQRLVEWDVAFAELKGKLCDILIDQAQHCSSSS